ncbi:hypothetical protein ZWY2020_052535 [Hordeum vulgare]|nr:hypothetical protein ZWY2020_052535 [Hordeum vulgare]
MDDKGNDGENLGDTGKDDKDMGDRGNEGKGMDDKDNDFIDMDPKGMDGTCTDDNDEDACKDGIDMDDVHLKGKGIDNKGMAGSDMNEYMEYLEIVNKTFRTQEETYMLYVVDVAIQIMRHDEPVDTRDGQLVYIERVVGVAKLERDGRIEKCYEDALADIPGTTQGTSYLKHDMVFLPTRSLNVRWFLVVVNPRRKEIRVLDSLFYCMVRGMEAHLRVAMRIDGIESNAWEHINVTQWLVRNIIVPKGDESALYMLKNIELFTGEKLRMQYDQAYIDKLRRELHVVLVDSPYNKMKYRKRFKQYHARLSDAAAVEDDEDARSYSSSVVHSYMWSVHLAIKR